MFYKTLLLAAICFIALTSTATAQDKVTPQANKELTHNGNEFDIISFPKDTTDVMDPITGEEAIVVTSKSDWFVSMNGERIKQVSKGMEGGSTTEYNDWYYKAITGFLTARIDETLKELNLDLQKGYYNYGIENVVIDKDGIVVFHKISGVTKVKVMGPDGKYINDEPITDAVNTAIQEQIKATLESTKVEYYEVGGEKQIASLHLHGSFEVL